MNIPGNKRRHPAIWRRGLFGVYLLTGPLLGRLYRSPGLHWVFMTLIQAKLAAFPERYAKGDLLGKVGRRAPLAMIPLLTRLYRNGEPVEFWWWLFGLLLRGAYWITLGILAGAVTGSAEGALVTLMAIATTHIFLGSLAEAPLTPPAPYYGAVGTPVALAALAAFVAGWPMAGGILAAGASRLYAPYLVVMTGMVGGGAYVTGGVQGTVSLLLFTAGIAPFILRNLRWLREQGETQQSPEEERAYRYRFRRWSYHFYIEKHLHQGVGFFGLLWFGALLLGPEAARVVPTPSLVVALLAGGGGALLIYTLNLYTLEWRPLTQSHAFRGTALIKGLLYPWIVAGLGGHLASLSERGLWGSLTLALMGIVALATSMNLSPASLYSRAAWVGLWRTEWIALAGSLALAASFPDTPWRPLLWGGGSAALLAPLTLAWLGSRDGLWRCDRASFLGEGDEPLLMRLRLINLFNAFFALVAGGMLAPSFALPLSPLPPIGPVGWIATFATALLAAHLRARITTGWGVVRAWVGRHSEKGLQSAFPDTLRYEGVAVWARLHSPEGALFVADPSNQSFNTVTFRYLAERSIWIGFQETVGYAYDRLAFDEGVRRMNEIGAHPVFERFYELAVDGTTFRERDAETWRTYAMEKGVDYLLVARETPPPLLPVVYEDRWFLVLALRDGK